MRVCVAMGMLLHSNEHLQISIVVNRLSMFATCGRISWKAASLSTSISITSKSHRDHQYLIVFLKLRIRFEGNISW
jgi:hypothetical protein